MRAVSLFVPLTRGNKESWIRPLEEGTSESNAIWIPQPIAYRGKHEPGGMLLFDMNY